MSWNDTLIKKNKKIR